MAFVIKDRVFEYTTVTGTGTLTLDGTKPGYQQFSAVGDGNTTYYTVVDPATGDWETGIGTYINSTDSLDRTYVISNSLGNTSKINFTAGNKQVFSAQPAGRTISVDTLDTDNNLAANSDSVVPSQKAIKKYIDGQGKAGRNMLCNGSLTLNLGGFSSANNTTSRAATITNWTITGTVASIFSTAYTRFPMYSDAPFESPKLTHKIISPISPEASAASAFIVMEVHGNNLGPAAFGTADARDLTLSFWVKCSKAGTFPISVLNSAGSISFVKNFTVNTANTWEYKTMLIAGCTTGTWTQTANVVMELRIPIVAGDNFITSTPNAWVSGAFFKTSGVHPLGQVGSADDTLDIARIQLEIGDTATPFEERSPEGERQFIVGR